MFSKAFDTPKAHFFRLRRAIYFFISVAGPRRIEFLEFSAMVDAPYAIREMNLSCRAAAGSCFVELFAMVNAPYTPCETGF